MGQRHQVYCFYYKRDELVCTSFHNQWCYGSLPLRHLKRIATFQKNVSDGSCISANSFDDIPDILKCILSVDLKDGTYSSYFDTTKETRVTKRKFKGTHNPSFGDNNDGITVLFFPKDSKRIKYCFTEDVYKNENIRPLSAREYALLYYKKSEPKWKGTGIDKLVPWIDKNCDLLTLTECIKFFPAWYEGSEEMKIAEADIDKVALFVDCKPSCKPLLENRLKGLPV